MTNSVVAKETKEDGKQYVMVKVDDEAQSPKVASSDGEASESEVKEELIECPEIVYKVQYKDISGEIKGTKELTAPYKLKKTS
jgi:hypothetical protein